MKPPMSNEKRSKIIMWAFLIALTLTQIFFLISNITTYGFSMHSIIPGYYEGAYLDFFKPFYESQKYNPYKGGLTDTPLVLLLGKFLSSFTKRDVFNYDISYMQHFAEATLVLFMAVSFSAILFAITVFSTKKGNGLFKAWFLFLIFFSTPFIYLFEQGSIVLFTVTLIMLYISGYDSDDKLTREFAHIALAAATGLSAYPIIFIILSYRKKRFGNAFRCLVYSFVIFFAPIFAFGGLGRLGYYFNNLKAVITDALDTGIAYRIDIISGLNLISLCLGKGLIESRALKLVLWGLILIVLLVCACISKSKWRTVLALSLIVSCGPFISMQANIAYLIIPLIMLIDSDEARIEADFIYTVFFILMLAPIAIKDCVINLAGNTGSEVYIYSLICTISVFLMILMLCIETVAAPLSGIELSARKREYAKQQAEKQQEK
ncbi:MAG: DUF2029 domain-containing protein [Lachnospiraceae bacterium]|nr:DUF2029 domain-containing protein [Lachnospiraceae bacterium]